MKKCAFQCQIISFSTNNFEIFGFLQVILNTLFWAGVMVE